MREIAPMKISILDFAPKMRVVENLKIGGKIEDFFEGIKKCNNITFEGEIIPPRLMSRNKQELQANAYKNYQKTRNLLEKFTKKPTDFLIINDISLFLHVGNKRILMESINKARTFFGNTYYGDSIKDKSTSLFSTIEKYKVKNLIKKIEKTYLTG